MSTPDLDIRLDPRGGIAALSLKRGGGEVLKTGVRGAFFAGRVEGRDSESAGRWTVLSGPAGSSCGRGSSEWCGWTR